mmetsp:Transcript_2924/g.6281  ORF Transcript_2924/g.6281 Transcript_2924/m.6281 type:complete len:367 (-) Transcript_2924:76-1176(-)
MLLRKVVRSFVLFLFVRFDSIRFCSIPIVSKRTVLCACMHACTHARTAIPLQIRSEIDLDAPHGTPIDVQNDPGAPGAGPRTQVQTGPGHVLLGAHAAQRNPFRNDLLGGSPTLQTLGHARCDKAGSQGVDGDVFRCQVPAQFFGQRVDGRLGGVVGVGRRRLGNHADDAPDVDDAGGIFGRGALFQHRHAGPGQIKDALDVQIQYLVESPIRSPRGPFEGFPPGGTRVVDQHVQLVVEYLGRVLCQFLAALSIGNIRGHVPQRRICVGIDIGIDSSSICVGDALDGLLAGGFGPGGQQDIGSGRYKILGDHQSDSPRSSRDQDVLARDGKEGIQNGGSGTAGGGGGGAAAGCCRSKQCGCGYHAV